MSQDQRPDEEFKLRFDDPATGAPVELVGAFEQSEWRQLLRFMELADELGRSSVIKCRPAVNISIKWTAEAGMKDRSSLPPDEVVAAFLHKLRPFVLESESSFVPKICGILKRRMRHPLIQSIVDKQLELFNGRDFQRMIQMKSGDTMVNSENIVQLWLNAFEYHRDEEKRDTLLSLHTIMPLETTRAIFLYMMIDKANAVLEIGWFIKRLRSREGVALTVKTQPGFLLDYCAGMSPNH